MVNLTADTYPALSPEEKIVADRFAAGDVSEIETLWPTPNGGAVIGIKYSVTVPGFSSRRDVYIVGSRGGCERWISVSGPSRDALAGFLR